METWTILLLVIGAYFLLKKGTPTGQANSKLGSVYNILNISGEDIIPIDTPENVFKKGMDEYYTVLKSVFDSETPEQRKQHSDISNPSPSSILSHVFFKNTGLEDALEIICRDINYVESGSGWTEYKKCLLNALGGGSIKKVKSYDDKIRIDFSKNLYIEADRTTYDYESEYPNYYWNIYIYKNKKEVLSCYGIPNQENEKKDASVFLFKPDYWIIEIRRVAERYSLELEKMKFQQSTKKVESSMFR